MRCAVITPIGPGHERLYEECRRSIRDAAQHSKGPFQEISPIAVDDTSGRQGRSAARNEAVRKAYSDNIEWLFFLDADDLLFPQAFESMKELIHDYDAIWGNIIEVLAGSNQVTQRIPQILSLSDIKELLIFDPYITLQMGHFVRTKVAFENPFNETMNTGEDFDYYLRVWSKYRCKKIMEPLFINRRGMHSTGPKSADGRDWRSVVEQQVDKYQKMFGLDHINIEMLQIMNNKALEFAEFAKQNMISDHNNYFQLSRHLPYYGYYAIDCYECPPFLMLSHNDDLVVNTIMWTGSYEPVSLSIWSRLAGNANLVFDIGAYSGIYGIIAARRNSNCTVVCIEPLDMNFSRIRENIILNSFNNISMLPIAVSNVDGEININLYSNNDFLATESSIKNINRNPVSVKKVQSISIDTLVQLNSIRKVDLVKIDVNGAELDVVEGMRKTIETFRPDLIISVPNNESANRLTEIFNKFGYNYFEIKEDSRNIRKTEVITSGTNLLDSNRLITIKNVNDLQQIFQINNKYGNINIIHGGETIDYKNYWESDNLENIIPKTNDQFPEGWDPSEVLREILKSYDFQTVLDFGCGYGRLCKAFDPNKYMGIDLNPNAIREAKRSHPEYNFREIDIDSTFDIVDVVLAYTVFLHLDDNTLNNILFRLSKSCQKLLVIGEILGREWRRPGNPPVFNRNIEDYICLISQYGFEFYKEYKRPYQRYASSPQFKDKNTDLSFLIFRKSAQ